MTTFILPELSQAVLFCDFYKLLSLTVIQASQRKFKALLWLLTTFCKTPVKYISIKG